MRQNGVAVAKMRPPTGGHREQKSGSGREPQRHARTVAVPSDPQSPVSAAVFLTDLGWFGLAGFGEVVFALTIGHVSADSVRSSLAHVSFPGFASECTPPTLSVAGSSCNRKCSTTDTRKGTPVEADWNPALRRRLEAFAAGEPCEFDDVELALPSLTPFQQRVIAATRGVGYGQTLAYGELAARAGAPRAARAVGTVMSSNRIPIIIPCHRIVASGGRLGGFSAPQGIDLKRRLLNMEAAAV